MISGELSFRLSPAFDLLPDITQKMSHTLMFLYHNFTSGQELVDLGRTWGVDNPGNIVREVCDAVSGFSSVAVDYGVDLKNNGDMVKDMADKALNFLKMR